MRCANQLSPVYHCHRIECAIYAVVSSQNHSVTGFFLQPLLINSHHDRSKAKRVHSSPKGTLICPFFLVPMALWPWPRVMSMVLRVIWQKGADEAHLPPSGNVRDHHNISLWWDYCNDKMPRIFCSLLTKINFLCSLLPGLFGPMLPAPCTFGPHSPRSLKPLAESQRFLAVWNGLLHFHKKAQSRCSPWKN